MSEGLSKNPEANIEGSFDVEKSNEVQEDFFNAMEATLNKEYNERNPKLPESERVLADVLDDQGRRLAQVDKVRDLTYESELDFRRIDMWYVVDFDDVINKTTDFNNALNDFVMSETGMTSDEYKEIYDSSKIPNSFSKNVLRFQEMKKTLDEKYPGVGAKIDEFMDSVDYNEFVDQGVKRALQSLHSHTQQVKISILTFGDTEYQKFRIDKTDLSDVVDEIIYTEGSKRETVQILYKEQIKKEEERRQKLRDEKDFTSFTGPLSRFTIFVDDSPEHIDDYNITELDRGYELRGEQRVHKDKFANIRYRNPQAKRHAKQTRTEKILVADETSSSGEVEKNSGAVDLHVQARLMQWYGDRLRGEDDQYIFELLNDRDKNIKELGYQGWLENDENIKFERDIEGNIKRTSDRLYYGDKGYKRESDKYVRSYEKNWGKINDDGAFDLDKILPDPEKKGLSSRHIPIRDFNFVEYIKHAK